MNKYRIVFMGTPAFSVPVLEAIVGAGYQVVAVVCQPDKPAGRGLRVAAPPVKLAGQRLGLPILQPASLAADRFVAELAATQPDLILVAAYGKYIPAAVLGLAPAGALNLHPSLLPRWRGACPANAAILAGDAETGLTVHFVVDQMDAGDILAQRRVPILPDDTAGSLMARLAPMGAELFVETLGHWLASEIAPQIQDHGAATWCDRLTKAQGRLDWTQPADALARQVRAFHPWPGAYTTWRGRILRVLAAEARPEAFAPRAGSGPGEVVAVAGDVAVWTGIGALALRVVQRGGGRPMTARDFARGAAGFIGDTL